jgi:hypothetical protein
MTTIIIDEKTKKGKIILDLVRKMKAGQILVTPQKNKSVYNQITLDAIHEAKEGQTILCDSYDDYLGKIKRSG